MSQGNYSVCGSKALCCFLLILVLDDFQTD